MEKSGFRRIGFIHNFREYPHKIRELAGVVNIDYSDFDSYIDAQWDNNCVLCYDEDLNNVSPESERIRVFLINIGYKKKDTDEDLFALFYRNSVAKLKTSDGWQGVEIGTQNELLELQKLRLFDSYTDVADYQFVVRTLQEITGITIDVETCKTVIRNSFISAKENNDLAVIVNEHDQDKKISFFPLLDYVSKTGEKLFVKMEKNRCLNRKEWYGAYITTKEELMDELLPFYFFHVGHFVFDSLQDANSFFNSLAQKAMKETWRWHDDKINSFYSQPILKSYLEFTYYRLLDEDEANEVEEEKKIIIYNGKRYFNSGLLDKTFRQIIIVGDVFQHQVQIPGLGECKWDLLRNICAYSHNEDEIASMFNEDELPGIASYFDDYRKVVFDAGLDIHTNDNHIFEDGVSRGRLPKYQEEYERVKNNDAEKELLLARIARDFDSARDRAKLMAERNYKLAVPQFWKETGEIQFLLPIYLGEREEAEKPQCALVLSLNTSGRRPYYRGETILTLDMAYNNTRLIAKPDVFWLNDLA